MSFDPEAVQPDPVYKRVVRDIRSYPGRTVEIIATHPADCLELPEGCSCCSPKTEILTTEYEEQSGDYGTRLVKISHHSPCFGGRSCTCSPLRESEYQFASLPEEGAKCWCLQPAVHKEWCRAHAPRCRSGAHFHGNCRCTGTGQSRESS